MFGSSGKKLFFQRCFSVMHESLSVHLVSSCKIYFPVVDLNINCNQEIDKSSQPTFDY